MACNRSTWAKRVRLACIASIASAIGAMAIPAALSTAVEAKTPGKTYCFVGKCHRVKTIEETQALVGVEQPVVASHYDDCSKDRFNPCGLTSSGERFHPDRPDNTASPIYPDGTQILVWNPDNKRALVVRVNNAGPYWGNRTLDLSRAAAEKLGFEGEGVAKLKMQVIKAPEEAETKYVENREYDPVPGDIGQYASLDDAQRGMAVVLAFKATTGSPFAPVTTANAFSGQSIGSNDMLVAEAPQSMGRTMTIAYYQPPSTSLAFGGFRTQSHPDENASLAGTQSKWGEDRVIDGPVKLSAVTEKSPVTETSSITQAGPDPTAQAAPEPRNAPEPRKAPEAEKSAKAKLAAAAYDEAKPRKKKTARNDDDGDRPEKSAKSKKTANKSEGRRSRREVASYEERGRRSYREENPRVAYSERSYGGGNGYSEGGRSAGQTMSDNLRPL
jgi:rare lipoprotein A (peptidoglycan hydrolase)